MATAPLFALCHQYMMDYSTAIGRVVDELHDRLARLEPSLPSDFLTLNQLAIDLRADHGDIRDDIAHALASLERARIRPYDRTVERWITNADLLREGTYFRTTATELREKYEQKFLRFQPLAQRSATARGIYTNLGDSTVIQVVSDPARTEADYVACANEVKRVLGGTLNNTEILDAIRQLPTSIASTSELTEGVIAEVRRAVDGLLPSADAVNTLPKTIEEIVNKSLTVVQDKINSTISALHASVDDLPQVLEDSVNTSFSAIPKLVESQVSGAFSGTAALIDANVTEAFADSAPLIASSVAKAFAGLPQAIDYRVARTLDHLPRRIDNKVAEVMDSLPDAIESNFSRVIAKLPKVIDAKLKPTFDEVPASIEYYTSKAFASLPRVIERNLESGIALIPDVVTDRVKVALETLPETMDPVMKRSIKLRVKESLSALPQLVLDEIREAFVKVPQLITAQVSERVNESFKIVPQLITERVAESFKTVPDLVESSVSASVKPIPASTSKTQSTSASVIKAPVATDSGPRLETTSIRAELQAVANDVSRNLAAMNTLTKSIEKDVASNRVTMGEMETIITGAKRHMGELATEIATESKRMKTINDDADMIKIRVDALPNVVAGVRLELQSTLAEVIASTTKLMKDALTEIPNSIKLSVDTAFASLPQQISDRVNSVIESLPAVVDREVRDVSLESGDDAVASVRAAIDTQMQQALSELKTSIGNTIKDGLRSAQASTDVELKKLLASITETLEAHAKAAPSEETPATARATLNRIQEALALLARMPIDEPTLQMRNEILREGALKIIRLLTDEERESIRDEILIPPQAEALPTAVDAGSRDLDGRLLASLPKIEKVVEKLEKHITITLPNRLNKKTEALSNLVKELSQQIIPLLDEPALAARIAPMLDVQISEEQWSRLSSQLPQVDLQQLDDLIKQLRGSLDIRGYVSARVDEVMRLEKLPEKIDKLQVTSSQTESKIEQVLQNLAGSQKQPQSSEQGAELSNAIRDHLDTLIQEVKQLGKNIPAAKQTSIDEIKQQIERRFQDMMTRITDIPFEFDETPLKFAEALITSREQPNERILEQKLSEFYGHVPTSTYSKLRRQATAALAQLPWLTQSVADLRLSLALRLQKSLGSEQISASVISALLKQFPQLPPAQAAAAVQAAAPSVATATELVEKLVDKLPTLAQIRTVLNERPQPTPEDSALALARTLIQDTTVDSSVLKNLLQTKFQTLFEEQLKAVTLPSDATATEAVNQAVKNVLRRSVDAAAISPSLLDPLRAVVIEQFASADFKNNLDRVLGTLSVDLKERLQTFMDEYQQEALAALSKDVRERLIHQTLQVENRVDLTPAVSAAISKQLDPIKEQTDAIADLLKETLTLVRQHGRDDGATRIMVDQLDAIIKLNNLNDEAYAENIQLLTNDPQALLVLQVGKLTPLMHSIPILQSLREQLKRDAPHATPSSDLESIAEQVAQTTTQLTLMSRLLAGLVHQAKDVNDKIYPLALENAPSREEQDNIQAAIAKQQNTMAEVTSVLNDLSARLPKQDDEVQQLKSAIASVTEETKHLLDSQADVITLRSLFTKVQEEVRTLQILSEVNRQVIDFKITLRGLDADSRNSKIEEYRQEQLNQIRERLYSYFEVYFGRSVIRDLLPLTIFDTTKLERAVKDNHSMPESDILRALVKLKEYDTEHKAREYLLKQLAAHPTATLSHKELLERIQANSKEIADYMRGYKTLESAVANVKVGAAKMTTEIAQQAQDATAVEAKLQRSIAQIQANLDNQVSLMDSLQQQVDLQYVPPKRRIRRDSNEAWEMGYEEGATPRKTASAPRRIVPTIQAERDLPAAMKKAETPQRKSMVRPTIRPKK